MVSFFRTKNDTQRLCDLHAAFYIILYWRNEKNDNICFKITFYNLFLVSCFVLSESIYLWLRRASRNEFVCQESVCYSSLNLLPIVKAPIHAMLNSAMTPAAVAEADPSMEGMVSMATAQCATASIITLFLCPFITAAFDKWMQKRQKGIYSPEGWAYDKVKAN